MMYLTNKERRALRAAGIDADRVNDARRMAAVTVIEGGTLRRFLHWLFK